ncbi:hypothetical protein OV090_31485 [Nannocystis sp. RBIL2]|uniref:hypothetical protein n=1 Tax=Nannocystis sp. RBIL2 TaxID=2996788 RepID=UPI00226E73FB|nr:hypothetical protein [Nannocystis sp. RBIL2]MCY1069306.1 hypothetical protein [Nannocystis sp. RBIL2]
MSEAPGCPRCGCPEVQVTVGRASACAPMPMPEVLRCPQCGNSGTRLPLHGRPIVRWEHDRPGEAEG